MTRPDPLGTVRLRPPVAEDLAALVAIHADPVATEHRPEGPLRDGEADAMLATWLEDWSRRGVGYWAVERRDGGAVIGFAGLRFTVVRGLEVLNLYYRLDPSAWGGGLASAIARHALAYAAQRHPGVPVVARMQPGHEASERTGRAAGLRPEGFDEEGRIVLADRALGWS